MPTQRDRTGNWPLEGHGCLAYLIGVVLIMGVPTLVVVGWRVLPRFWSGLALGAVLGAAICGTFLSRRSSSN
jgi:hypothetical protein